VSKIEGPGRIALSGRVEGEQLVLRVENNGPLLRESESGGVGVRNTKARLAHLYGDEQSFALRGTNTETPLTVAEIRLPYHTRADLRTPAVATLA
jgi:LytS/YehU family sensor histidine kinase